VEILIHPDPEGHVDAGLAAKPDLTAAEIAEANR
jgi:hypothetical protein